mgnify:CR=1 FL=1
MEPLARPATHGWTRWCAARTNGSTVTPSATQPASRVASPHVVDGLVVALLVACAAAALVLGVEGLRGRDPLWWHLGVVAAVEVLLLVQAVVAVVLLVQGDQIAGSAGVFIAYLVGTLLALPLTLLWGLGEPSRWTLVALAVACLVVAVLVLRLDQIWVGA